MRPAGGFGGPALGSARPPVAGDISAELSPTSANPATCVQQTWYLAQQQQRMHVAVQSGPACVADTLWRAQWVPVENPPAGVQIEYNEDEDERTGDADEGQGRGRAARATRGCSCQKKLRVLTERSAIASGEAGDAFGRRGAAGCKASPAPSAVPAAWGPAVGTQSPYSHR
ncbi:hypothetical protein B0H10DRAFT_2244447 [Mycena sp. CBHHK59/15]|nr:hypothetical protein B0H10DRAFT_2244447 [Mycena sp. CBHHK59/15]